MEDFNKEDVAGAYRMLNFQQIPEQHAEYNQYLMRFQVKSPIKIHRKATVRGK